MMKILLIALSIGLITTSSITLAGPIDSKIITQKSSSLFNFKSKALEPITLYRKGAGRNNVVQGMTIDNKNQILYSLNVTGNPEKGVVNRFNISKQLEWTAIDAQKPSPYIGHQGISFDPLSETFYSSAGQNVDNRGWHIVNFSYQPNALPTNVRVIQVFNEGYSKNLNTMPSISPNGALLVIRGKKGKNNIIRIYDFNKVRQQQDLTSGFNTEWKVDLGLTEGGIPFQAMTTDGKYVYMLSGKGNHMPKRLYIYTINGTLVQKHNDVLLGLEQAKKIGKTQLWEPEGLAVDAIKKQLMIMYAIGDSGQRRAHLYKLNIQ